MMAGSGVEAVSTGVAWPADVGRANDMGKRVATALGFSAAESEEVALVVTELAKNLLRHATGGTIRAVPLAEGSRRGIEIRSSDNGPGIADVEQAITDGYSTAGGLGLGLGTVNRLMDEFEIYSRAEGGADIVCRRWRRPPSTGSSVGRIAFGAATRAHRNSPENGDTFLFRQWEGSALAGVIDGLGHGQFARRASQTARQYIEQHFDQPLEALFRGAGRACRSTRGVVMALAKLDLVNATVTVGSIGNIEVRLAESPTPFNLIVRRGIVGLNAPNPVLLAHPWTPGTILVMHSDGVGTRWNWSEFGDLTSARPAVIARQLLSKLGKTDDDATVIVVRSAQ
jgi:anti-sigma regulatory factor (Ser/Thr protein kinase)